MNGRAMHNTEPIRIALRLCLSMNHMFERMSGSDKVIGKPALILKAVWKL